VTLALSKMDGEPGGSLGRFHLQRDDLRAWREPVEISVDGSIKKSASPDCAAGFRNRDISTLPP
jgi:hypothetical protein